MEIYLVRHGESIDDVEDCYGGIADFALTQAGKELASELTGELTKYNIEILFSSPYKRARETANIISKGLACDVEIIEELRERNTYGVLSGVNKDKAKDIFGHIFTKITQKPGYYTNELVVGAEPVEEFDKRVKEAMMRITEIAKDNQSICIVTHGNVTRSIYKQFLNFSKKIDLELLAITKIKVTNGVFSIDWKRGIKVLD